MLRQQRRRPMLRQPMFRSLESVFRLWLGNHFVDRILKSSEFNVHPRKKKGRFRLSTKHGVRIGLFLLGILVLLSLFTLARVLWRF